MSVTQRVRIDNLAVMTADELTALIEAGLPDDSQASVTGEGSHFQATVVSAAFDGLNMVKQHQLVYQALGDTMQGAVHALTIKTYTPEQWEQARKLQVL